MCTMGCNHMYPSLLLLPDLFPSPRPSPNFLFSKYTLNNYILGLMFPRLGKSSEGFQGVCMCSPLGPEKLLGSRWHEFLSLIVPHQVQGAWWERNCCHEQHEDLSLPLSQIEHGLLCSLISKSVAEKCWDSSFVWLVTHVFPGRIGTSLLAHSLTAFLDGGGDRVVLY